MFQVVILGKTKQTMTCSVMFSSSFHNVPTLLERFLMLYLFSSIDKHIQPQGGRVTLPARYAIVILACLWLLLLPLFLCSETITRVFANEKHDIYLTVLHP